MGRYRTTEIVAYRVGIVLNAILEQGGTLFFHFLPWLEQAI